MRLASKFATIAALTLGLSSAAFAASPIAVYVAAVNGGSPNNPSPLVCVAAPCGPQYATPTQDNCADKLQGLPKITGRQIEGIDEQRLHVAPLCDFANHSLTDVQKHDLAAGNVVGLRAYIEANPTVMAELDEHGYRSVDVVGILLGSNAAVLYVHKV